MENFLVLHASSAVHDVIVTVTLVIHENSPILDIIISELNTRLYIFV